MIQSIEQPVVMITAIEHRRGFVACRRSYLLRGSRALWRVEELPFSAEWSPETLCNFDVGPQGYRSISVRTGAAGSAVGLRMDRSDGGRVVVERGTGNGEEFPADDDLFLCDGPNPLFDYFNVMHLLGVPPGEERIVPVHVLDTRHGRMRREQYVYTFDGSTITAHKGRDKGPTTLELDEHYAISRATSGDADLIVSRCSALFLN